MIYAYTFPVMKLSTLLETFERKRRLCRPQNFFSFSHNLHDILSLLIEIPRFFLLFSTILFGQCKLIIILSTCDEEGIFQIEEE